MSTPQERREALTHVLPYMALTVPLVESWLAEKDAELAELRRHYDDIQHVLTDAFTERDTIRTDERRRTAEEIKRRTDSLKPSVAGMYVSGYMNALADVVRICDEVGGSDDQQQ